MSRSDETLVESLIRLVDTTCSVRWSLAHWLTKKVCGEPTARVLAELALPRTAYFRKQVWTELKRLPGQDLVRLMTALLPHRRRRRFLKQIKKEFGPEMQQAFKSDFFQQFKGELESGMTKLAAQCNTDQKPIADRLFPELQCNLNTLCAEPSRAEKSFPMEILKSPRERQRLRSELPPRNPASELLAERFPYGCQLVTVLYQIATNPFSLDLPSPRSNDLLFDVVEQRPSDDLTSGQVANALLKLLQALSEEEKAKILCQHLMSRILRHEFGLSRDRNTQTFSKVESDIRTEEQQTGAEPSGEPWEPEDALSVRGYEDVDYRQQYEALRDRLPPKQGEALGVYFESYESRESIEDICARRRLDPVTVRNNFQAVKKKASMGKL